MALQIDTFNNQTGGHSFFKAIGHPLAAEKARLLFEKLKKYRSLCIFDPKGFLAPFSEIYSLRGLALKDVFVQRYEDLEKVVGEKKVKPITELPRDSCEALFVLSFDADKIVEQISHLLPPNCEVLTLDQMRLEDEMLTNPRKYLDPMNWATNFAFFRDEDGLHTRLVTANYWSGYSKKPATAWLRLLDGAGTDLATWKKDLGKPNQTLVLDSAEIRKQLNLDAFCGQLFIHVIGAAGHDIVKYALDIYSDDGKTLSCTHDANAWPADYYAGLPAPQEGEDVILWVQNSHPCPIPAGRVGLNLMGSEKIAWLPREIAPFASYALNVTDLLPDAKWPQQLEVQAGKYFVRPRYEIVTPLKRRIAHANVERTDLKPDPALKKLNGLFGKGFLLPAPILPPSLGLSKAMPNPMARSQNHLPLTLLCYNANGQEIGRHAFGNLKRSDSIVFDVNKFLEEKGISLKDSFGHMEFIYDFEAGEEADGWLHGLFRYTAPSGGHAAETSFGGHIFNTLVTYKSQPHSYRGDPPGLTTRLFLRLGTLDQDTHCHLIYPASAPWIKTSSTELQLHNSFGELVATRKVTIPCSGSLYWRVKDYFPEEDLRACGEAPYIIIRDTTCRLFGYHGIIDREGRFSLDHMFGF